MNTLFLRYLTEMQNKGRLKFYENHSLSLVSTFGIGGRARVFVMPLDEECFKDTVRLASICGRYIVIGNASNLLFDDRGFYGTVISTVKLRSLELLLSPRSREEGFVFEGCREKRIIKASCGVMLPSLSAFALKNGIKGFEGLCSIPATVGGALCLNAGAYGTEISDTLIAYEVYFPQNDEKRLIISDKKEFSYRKSSVGKQGETVLYAYFLAQKGDEAQIRERIEKNKAFRQASQPIGERSAGSYFKRPNESEGLPDFRGKSAGEIIDICGLKGTAVGQAQISRKHGNFLINKSGKATACEVLALAERVKKAVYKRTRIRLKEEVEFIHRLGKGR